MRNARERQDRGLYDFLFSYIMDHPEQFQYDKDCCGDCSKCGVEKMGNCVIPKPEDIELFDYDIKDISAESTGLDIVTLDITIEAHVDVYKFGRDYQDEPDQITEWYHMEACLDFGEFQIKCLEISLYEEG